MFFFTRSFITWMRGGAFILDKDFNIRWCLPSAPCSTYKSGGILRMDSASSSRSAGSWIGLDPSAKCPRSHHRPTLTRVQHEQVTVSRFVTWLWQNKASEGTKTRHQTDACCFNGFFVCFEGYNRCSTWTITHCSLWCDCSLVFSAWDGVVRLDSRLAGRNPSSSDWIPWMKEVWNIWE